MRNRCKILQEYRTEITIMVHKVEKNLLIFEDTVVFRIIRGRTHKKKEQISLKPSIFWIVAMALSAVPYRGTRRQVETCF